MLAITILNFLADAAADAGGATDIISKYGGAGIGASGIGLLVWIVMQELPAQRQHVKELVTRSTETCEKLGTDFRDELRLIRADYRDELKVVRASAQDERRETLTLLLKDRTIGAG